MDTLADMESRNTPSDAALAVLADSEGAVRRMSWLAIGGLAFWLVVLGVFTWLLGILPELTKQGTGWRVYAWSIPAVPILLHLWPILRLSQAAQALSAFAAAPSEAGAVVALRAQRVYWRAAFNSHFIILLWFIFLIGMECWGSIHPGRFPLIRPNGTL